METVQFCTICGSVYVPSETGPRPTCICESERDVWSADN